MAHILIVDDEEIMRDILGNILSKEGHSMVYAENVTRAREAFSGSAFDLVISDLRMPDGNGLDLLKEFLELDPGIAFIVITAYGTIETAIEAIKLGASDFITKPFKNEEILRAVLVSLNKVRVVRENMKLKEKIRQEAKFQDIVGQSLVMRRIYQQIEQVARTQTTVFLVGESGTGKELVARAIHARSDRALEPFVVVNTSNLTGHLFESNAFGYEKGAFTGADRAKKGLFESADGGTIFLDEIGNIVPDIQSKLLRFIQEKEFIRLGGSASIKVDVRIITATNADIKAQVADGRFREDLYYRLNVAAITIPPLRKRREDIPLLVAHFIERFNKEQGKSVTGVTDKVRHFFNTHNWPGNVRELKNMIESAVLFSQGPVITRDNLPDAMAAGHPGQRTDGAQWPLDFYSEITDLQESLIREALARAKGVQKRAAALLNLRPSTLSELMKRLHITRRDYVDEQR